MNTGLLFKSLHQAINSKINSIFTLKILSVQSVQNTLNRGIHPMYNRPTLHPMPNNLLSPSTSKILQPVLPMYNPICGLKVKGRLELRCKDCYYVTRHERLYVMCKTHPRHKQTQMKKKEYKTWILTCASQSKVRGW